MANLRDLKKDIKQMVEHFIQECYIQLTYSPPLNQENVLDIISDATQLRDETLKLLNNPVCEQDRKSRRMFFKKLIGDFYDGIIELTERLNSLEY
jgi:hypothetical protein